MGGGWLGGVMRRTALPGGDLVAEEEEREWIDAIGLVVASTP